MAKTMKKLDSKLENQQQDRPKISNTARKYNEDENLENYESEVQMYARAHSGLTKITWDQARARGEFRVCKVQNILHTNCFMFMLLISNHTVFFVQFGINLHLWVFKKRNCTRRSGSYNFSFLKTLLVQITSKLNSKPYDYLYKTM